MIFSTGSSRRDWTTTGRKRASNARSAMRVERFADRVAPNVASASTSVPPAVASEATVDQSAMSDRPAVEIEGARHAAVDGDDLAGDEARRVGREEHDDVGDVLGDG